MTTKIKVEEQPVVRHAVFKTCYIYSIQLLETFKSLAYLELNSCKFEVEVSNFYNTIGKLTALIGLSLINLKKGFRK